MIFKKQLYLSMALAAAGALSACGGGSSSSTPPVADVPSLPPVPDAETLTVTGFVTDMPIANATVILSVNGQQFEAPNPTGADGSFEVEIESSDPDALVQCEAFDPNGPARFSALLNSFAGLQEDAGDDGVADEVNITNVTTAQYLLAQELAADGSIDSIEELEEVSGQIDANELLELSAAIKVVVDSLQGVALPDEFDDVQELAQAIIDGTTTFVEDIEVLNPGILDDAIEEVITDGFATEPFAADKVAGVYLDNEGDDMMVLYADGTGYSGEEEILQDSQGNVFDNLLVEAVTWTITDSGALQIVFTEAQDVDTAVLLNRAGSVLTLHVSSVEGDGVVDEPDTFSVVQLGFDANGFDATTVPGSYRGTEVDEGESETEYTVFLEDGSGYDIDVATGVMDDFFTWEVNAAGELILIDDGVADNGEVEVDDEREVIRLLEGSTTDTLNLLVMETGVESDAVVDIEAFPVLYTAEIFTGPEPDMANTMLLEGKSYGYSDGDETGIVTFAANGVFTEIWQDFDEIDGPEYGEDEGEWWVDDNGTIYVTFVEVDGTVDNGQASVVSGLGGDRMVIMVDDDGANSELVLDLVVPFTAADVTGTFAFQDVTGQLTPESLVLNADGTGSYFDDGVNDGNFEWDISSTGKLVLTLDDGPGAVDVYTDNYYKLADSQGDFLHVMFVYRRNGELDNDSDDLNGPPSVVEVFSVIRQQ